MHRHIHDFAEGVTDVFRIAHHDAKSALAFIYLARFIPPDAGLDHLLHFVYVEAVRRHGIPVDLDVQVGLSRRLFELEVIGTRQAWQDLGDALAGQIQRFKIFPEHLDGNVAFHAARQLVHTHGDGLCKVISQPRLGSEEGADLFSDVFFAESASPLVAGFEDHPHIGLVYPHPVVGKVATAGFGHYRLNLGDVAHDFAGEPVRVLDRFTQRHARHADLFDENGSFIELWQKLGAQARHDNHRQSKNNERDADDQRAFVEAFFQHALVARA